MGLDPGHVPSTRGTGPENPAGSGPGPILKVRVVQGLDKSLDAAFCFGEETKEPQSVETGSRSGSFDS